MDSLGSAALCPIRPSRTFEDVDELTDHLAGWDLELTQLAASPIVGSHGSARIGPMLLQGGQTVVPLIQRGAAPPLVTFSILSAPEIRVTFRGRDRSGEHILVSRPGVETHWRTGPDFRVRTLSVEEGLLRETGRLLGLERGIDLALGVDSIRPAPDALTGLRRAVYAVPMGSLELPTTSPSVDLEHPLLLLLVRTLASHEGTIESDRVRQLDQVMHDVQALLSRHPDRAFTREELSGAVGVSDRSIRRATKLWYGTSPAQLVKVRRLHGARRELRRADPRRCKVIDVAVRWGFTHMSRFAGDYSTLFGERPSDTLRSSPRGVPRRHHAERTRS